MKNILAENMLRFGVKNLKESDVKKIARLQEETVIQPFAAINAKSWKLKDAASELAINTAASYFVRVDPKAAAAGVYGPWAQEYNSQASVAKKMHPNAALIAKDIAQALAVIMMAQGIYDPMRYKDFALTVKNSYAVSKAIKSKIGDYSTPAETIGNPEPDLALSPNANQFGEATTQQQWEATLAIIAPAITAVIQKYVLPAEQAPAPTTTPGKTTPAPVPGTRP